MATPSLSHEPQRLIFLGAPSNSFIDKDTLLDPNAALPWAPQAFDASALPAHPTWRILHHTPRRLTTGFTQNSYPSLEPDHTAGILHSYRLHSQLPSPVLSEPSLSFDEDDTAFLTTFSEDPSFLNPTQDPDRPPIPALVSLTDLEDLPRHARIALAPPNTLFITALVAVLSIAEVRTLTTKYGRKVQLVSLVVGDPTYAPFRVDIWLPLRPDTVDEMELKAVVRELRVQDVIVLKNLRLGVWKEQRFATTWRVGSSGGSAIWVVHRVWCGDAKERRKWRRRWDETMVAERKVASVVRWAQEFVEVPPSGTSVVEEFPADTPETRN
jgi:hypothetical protein